MSVRGAPPLRLASLGRLAAVVALVTWASACHETEPPKPSASTDPPEWKTLAQDLPEALLSVSGRSSTDVFAVGADKGHGPLVVHFDGKSWKQLQTGQTGDLWWVQAVPGGHAVLMAGASAMVLRYDGSRFERLETPGLGRQTVYGVWGKSADDFYAVGSAGGRSGFVWHYRAGTFENEAIPVNVPRVADGQTPGFFKVWGDGDDVWVVGAAGTILHRKGKAPFGVAQSPTKETLFTISGDHDRLLAVGGGSNGVLLERTNGAFHDTSPTGTALLQGVYASPQGDWASGERGLVYARPQPGSRWVPVEHGLSIPAAYSLHSIYADETGGVWSVGGDVLSPALDHGMMIHYGSPVPPVVVDRSSTSDAAADSEVPAVCAATVVAAGKTDSIARRWDEQALAAIRLDLPRPTVHSRNLFHVSAAMWDAWAAYDTTAKGYFVRERHTAPDIGEARRIAISYAAYRVLVHRYATAVGGRTSVACFHAVMQDLGFDANDEHDTGDDPVALGNRIGHTVIAKTKDDGANEANDYVDNTGYVSPNASLIYDNPGAPLREPERWQPINLSVAATQNGIIVPAGVQAYVGAQWGRVTPFAMTRSSDAVPWHDPGPAPTLGPAMTAWIVEVIGKTAAVGSTDPIDISPGAYGHNTLGTNDGKGWAKNPVTGEPYAPQVVPKGDFFRVMAEFWADGPNSETPPGHWNTIANAVSNSPGFARQLFGRGPSLDPLAWDVHVYLALNGAVHDAAISAWDIKRRKTTVRPISLVRWMGAKGQSSDPKGPSYDPGGLPLVPGLIEVITKESSAPGQRHAGLAFYVGQMAVRGWLGEPGDRTHQIAGVGWVRAVDWITYQRRTFVTPAFPAWISGHSTFSRAGAEVLASVTGSPYFPGGFGEYVAPKGTFLAFEKGPSQEVRLQWASYFDASDEAGQSRLWGSIHIAPDDFAGRKVGALVGRDAVRRASTYYDGTAP
jgi:hypothetical protein